MAELFDIVVRRQIYIEGLKATKGVEFAAALAKLRTELAHRLAGFEYDDLGNATKTSIRKLIVDLRKIAKAVFDPYLTALIDWLQRFVRVDLALLAMSYGEARPDRRDALQTAPNSDDMWALAIAAPLAATGTLALPFLAALLPSLYVKLERLTMQHFANRSTRADLITAIVGSPNTKEAQGYLRQLQAQSNAATNTVLQHLANQINDTLGSKIVGFYEWVSVLDDRTTKICTDRDGNRYAYGRGPIPPAHVNCRSTTVPVDIDAPASPNSFSQWLRGQPDEFVSDALDGRRGARYERASPITLNAYGAKGPLITA
jgi:SPP1 gp7 family putative phage head morphogenesis protein